VIDMFDDEEDEDREARALREARDSVRRLKREAEKKRDDLEKRSSADLAHILLPMADARVTL
jgi:hypothetical protein